MFDENLLERLEKEYVGKHESVIDVDGFPGYYVRILGHDECGTMDLRDDRITFYLDKDEVVAHVSIG